MKVVYIAHRFSDETPEAMAKNREAAKQWVVWAWHQAVAPVAPWLVLTEMVEETPETRRRGMASNEAVISRCDELWLCGPRTSLGMHEEAGLALCYGVPVVDYTGSELPPEGT